MQYKGYKGGVEPMEKIAVLIPCYNEEENVVPMSEAVADIFAKELPEYDYELVFIVKFRWYARSNL